MGYGFLSRNLVDFGCRVDINFGCRLHTGEGTRLMVPLFIVQEYKPNVSEKKHCLRSVYKFLIWTKISDVTILSTKIWLPNTRLDLVVLVQSARLHSVRGDATMLKCMKVFSFLLWALGYYSKPHRIGEVKKLTATPTIELYKWI